MTKEKYFELPAVKGIQAGRPYYSVMCPLDIVTKLFCYVDNTLPINMRAQRVLNKQRIPEMKNYILNNRKSYVFSSLTATIDGYLEFTSKNNSSVGYLKIGMNSRILINDGQHRRAAIEEALKEASDLKYEDISIVIYDDIGLKRSQQIFSDLNRYAVRSTRSLNILFDNRDEFAILLRKCIDEIPIFNGSVETEKSTISNRSKALFTLSGIYNASKDLTLSLDNEEEIRNTIVSFWIGISENLIPWQSAKNHEIPPDIFRKSYVCAHTIMLKALGAVGHYIITNEKAIGTWERRLEFLKSINWSKSNEEFAGVIVVNNKIAASRNNLSAFVSYLEDRDRLYIHRKANK